MYLSKSLVLIDYKTNILFFRFKHLSVRFKIVLRFFSRIFTTDDNKNKNHSNNKMGEKLKGINQKHQKPTRIQNKRRN